MTKLLVGRLKPTSGNAVHLVGGTDLPTSITIARASVGTSINNSGRVTNVPNDTARYSLTRGLLIEESRTNVCLFSQPLGQATGDAVTTTSTVRSPDGSNNALRVTATANVQANSAWVQQNSPIPNDSATYTLSGYLRKGSSTQNVFYGILSNGTVVQLNGLVSWGTRPEDRPVFLNCQGEYAGNGWWRVWINLTNNSTGNLTATVRVYVKTQAADYVQGDYIDTWGWQIEVGTYPTSWLLTGAATVTRAQESGTMPMSGIMPTYVSRNLMTFSEQLNNAAWIKSANTITSDATNDPLGLLTADKIIPTAVSSTHNLTSAIYPYTVAGTPVTMSAFFKLAEYGVVRFILRELGTTSLISYIYDYGTGTMITAPNITANGVFMSSEQLNVGGGWWRLSLTGYFTGAVTGVRMDLSVAPTAALTFTGDGVSGTYMWGAQMTYSATVPSYAVTTAAALTGSTKGTLVVDATYVYALPTGNAIILSLYDDANNQLTFYYNSSLNKLLVVLLYGGFSVADTQFFIPVSAAVGTRFRMAVSWDASTRQLSVQFNAVGGLSAVKTFQVEFLPQLGTMGLGQNGVSFSSAVLNINRVDFLRTPVAGTGLASLIS